MAKTKPNKKRTGYNTWIAFCFYDLPYDTPAACKAAARFHRRMKKIGWDKNFMPHTKVYLRWFGGFGKLEKLHTEVMSIVPPDAEIRIVPVTDKQFGKILTGWGKMRKPTL
ncbi:MAG TPA: hypothetical protein VMW25_00445 [Clostridia bacterium]|nr:hypothetical protein [Clostridia bacterium]